MEQLVIWFFLVTTMIPVVTTMTPIATNTSRTGTMSTSQHGARRSLGEQTSIGSSANTTPMAKPIQDIAPMSRKPPIPPSHPTPEPGAPPRIFWTRKVAAVVGRTSRYRALLGLQKGLRPRLFFWGGYIQEPRRTPQSAAKR